MKLKKIISVIAALAISSCFVISASAATTTEDKKLTVTPVVGVDKYGHYEVKYELSYNGSLEIKTVEVGRDILYQGSGIYAFEFSINNISESDFAQKYSSAYQKAIINLVGSTLKIGATSQGSAETVWSTKPDENIVLATISTNYTPNQKTHNEIYNIFKNIGKTIIKVYTTDSTGVEGKYNVSDDDIVGYGINEDGKTKHVDAVYKLNVATLANISGNTVSFDNEETSSIEDGKQLVVLSQNLDGATLNKDNKIAITYGDETRESAKTIFELLGIEGEGSVTGRTINVNVKTVDTNSADGFSFEIK